MGLDYYPHLGGDGVVILKPGRGLVNLVTGEAIIVDDAEKSAMPAFTWQSRTATGQGGRTATWCATPARRTSRSMTSWPRSRRARRPCPGRRSPTASPSMTTRSLPGRIPEHVSLPFTIRGTALPLKRPFSVSRL